MLEQVIYFSFSLWHIYLFHFKFHQVVHEWNIRRNSLPHYSVVQYEPLGHCSAMFKDEACVYWGNSPNLCCLFAHSPSYCCLPLPCITVHNYVHIHLEHHGQNYLINIQSLCLVSMNINCKSNICPMDKIHDREEIPKVRNGHLNTHTCPAALAYEVPRDWNWTGKYT